MGAGGRGRGGGGGGGLKNRNNYKLKLPGTFPLSIVAGLNLPATSRIFLFLFPQKIAKLVEIALENIKISPICLIKKFTIFIKKNKEEERALTMIRSFT